MAEISFAPANPAHAESVEQIKTILSKRRMLPTLVIGIADRCSVDGAILLDREDAQILAQLLSNIRVEGEAAADHSDGLRQLAIWARAVGSL